MAKKIATYPLWMLVWKVCSVNSNELFGNSWQKYRREDGGPTAFHALASRGSGLAKAGHQERYCFETARASLMQHYYYSPSRGLSLATHVVAKAF